MSATTSLTPFRPPSGPRRSASSPGAPGGRVGPERPEQLSALTFNNQSITGFSVFTFMNAFPEVAARAQAEMLAALAEGTLRVVTQGTYGLARVADAHRAVEARQTVGKVVLIPRAGCLSDILALPQATPVMTRGCLHSKLSRSRPASCQSQRTGSALTPPNAMLPTAVSGPDSTLSLGRRSSTAPRAMLASSLASGAPMQK